MAAEANLGLEWRAKYNRGGTPVGVARARDIGNRTNLSPDTVGRMVSFFARHEVDKKGQGFTPDQKGYPSAGRIAWALWGGDPGQSWANARLLELNKVQNDYMQIQILNKIGKLNLNTSVSKDSADALIDQLDELYGNSAVLNKLFINEIVCKAEDALTAVEVVINSPGGSVFEGQRIFNALRKMSARGVQIITVVDGLAASMGSVVLMAGDKRGMTEGSRIMIHEASTIASGDAAELHKQANLLESISEQIANTYHERTGMPKNKMREMMIAETWMTTDQAIKYNFIDYVIKNGIPLDVNKVDISKNTGEKVNMNFIDRITNPSSEESINQIASLTLQISNQEIELQGYVSKFAEIELALQEAATYKADLNITQTKVVDLQENVIAQNAEILDLQKKILATEQSVADQSIAILATIGQPEPLEEIELTEAQIDHIKILATLSGSARTNYYSQHSEQIRKTLIK